MAELEEKRARRAAVESELAELGARHDLAMSAFKFDEAREVQERINALERERAELVEALPTVVPPAPAGPPRTPGSLAKNWALAPAAATSTTAAMVMSILSFFIRVLHDGESAPR